MIIDILTIMGYGRFFYGYCINYTSVYFMQFLSILKTSIFLEQYHKTLFFVNKIIENTMISVN